MNVQTGLVSLVGGQVTAGLYNASPFFNDSDSAIV